MRCLENTDRFLLRDLSKLGVELIDKGGMRIADKQANVQGVPGETGVLPERPARTVTNGNRVRVLEDDASRLFVRNHLFGRLQRDVLLLCHQLYGILQLHHLAVIGARVHAPCRLGNTLNGGLEHLIHIIAHHTVRSIRRNSLGLERVIHEVLDVLQVEVGVIEVVLVFLWEQFEEGLRECVMHSISLSLLSCSFEFDPLIATVSQPHFICQQETPPRLLHRFYICFTFR